MGRSRERDFDLGFPHGKGSRFIDFRISNASQGFVNGKIQKIIGSRGEQPLEETGKEQCESAAVPQL